MILGQENILKKYKGKDNLDCIKMNFYFSKDTIQETEEGSLRMGDIFKTYNMCVHMTHNQKILQKPTY